jgi:uncharacterized protein
MRVFVTGATGFVGWALIPRLQRDGHAVVAWVRSPVRARGLLGAEVELVHADTAPDGLVAAIERSDAVVNLAGEPLMGGRRTAARRAVLEGSRIAVTEQLVRAMAEAKSRPRVFISGSAVGFTAIAPMNCSRKRPAPPTIFWARLCRRWECAAQEADRLGARVVLCSLEVFDPAHPAGQRVPSRENLGHNPSFSGWRVGEFVTAEWSPTNRLC